MKLNDSKVTVIIPNYNKGVYLGKCIDSVLKQKGIDLNIIVVDDNSTDNSKDILLEYQSKYEIIKTIYLKKNSGVSHARNLGATRAVSKYITFLDSDDFYLNEYKLKNECDILDINTCGISKDVVAYSIWKKTNLDTDICDEIEPNPSRLLMGNVYSSLLWNKFDFMYLPRDYIIPRDLFLKAGGFNEESNYYEDLELLIKLSRSAIFMPVLQYGSAYRRVSGGLSNRRIRDSILARTQIFKNELKEECGSKLKILILTIVFEIRIFLSHIKTIINTYN